MTPEVAQEVIKVFVAKLWQSIIEVEIPVGSTAMNALRKAGLNLDSVVSIKRNWAVVTLDTGVAHEDTLLVSMDKIKGWLAEESSTPAEGKLIKLSFKIVKENQVDTEGQVAYTDDMSTFEIVKQALHSKGVSLNSFKEIKDAEGNIVTFADKLVDGGAYKLVITDNNMEASDNSDED